MFEITVKIVLYKCFYVVNCVARTERYELKFRKHFTIIFVYALTTIKYLVFETNTLHSQKVPSVGDFSYTYYRMVDG